LGFRLRRFPGGGLAQPLGIESAHLELADSLLLEQAGFDIDRIAGQLVGFFLHLSETSLRIESRARLFG
jgi:hypothetical protein